MRPLPEPDDPCGALPAPILASPACSPGSTPAASRPTPGAPTRPICAPSPRGSPIDAWTRAGSGPMTFRSTPPSSLGATRGDRQPAAERGPGASCVSVLRLKANIRSTFTPAALDRPTSTAATSPMPTSSPARNGPGSASSPRSIAPSTGSRRSVARSPAEPINRAWPRVSD